MKRFLLLVTFISAITLSQAQKLHYGFHAGTNLSTMKIGNELYLNSDYENCRKPFLVGFSEGLFVEYTPFKFLGFQGEISFAEYGYRLKIQRETNDVTHYEGDFKGMSQSKTTISNGNGNTTINSINISLLLKFYLAKQHLSIDIGAQPNWVISTYRKENLTITESSTTTFNGELLEQKTETKNENIAESVPFNSSSFSLIGGMTYYINPKIFVSARYIFGLKDVFTKKVLHLQEVPRLDNEGNPVIGGDGEPVIDFVPYEEVTDQLSKHRVIQLTLGLRFK